MKPPLFHWIATGLGVGLLPRAPGTAGSLLGLAAATAFRWAASRGVIAPWAEPAALISLCGVGVWAAARYGEATGRADDQTIVVDEVTGQWITTLPLSIDPTHPAASLARWGIAFLVFRILDIWKPWPIRRLDRLSKRLKHPLAQGFGVMADDWLAAAIGAGALYYLLPL